MINEHRKPLLFSDFLKAEVAARESKRDRAILYMAVDLGLRAYEISSLRIKDLLTPHRNLFEKICIGEKRRYVYIYNTLTRMVIMDYIAIKMFDFNKDELLFTKRNGDGFSPEEIEELIVNLFESKSNIQ